MKRVISLLLVVVMCLGLTGCGGNKLDPNAAVTLHWDGVNYTHNGNTLNFRSFAGDTAMVYTAISEYSILIDNAKDVTNIIVNNQGIEEENMDKYKELFYYQEYLGSKTTGAMLIGPDTWGICQTGAGTPNVLAKDMYDILSVLPLTTSAVYVDVAGIFTFGTEWDKVECRPDKILIKDIIQVLPGQIHPSMEPYTFSTIAGMSKSGMFGVTDKYDYYYLDGYTIQIYKGGDIYDYIAIN